MFHGTCLATLLVAQPWSSGSEVAEWYNIVKYVYSFYPHFITYRKTLHIFSVMMALSAEEVPVNTKVCVGLTVSGGNCLFMSHKWLLVPPLEDSVPSTYSLASAWKLHVFLALDLLWTLVQAGCADEKMPTLIRYSFPGVSAWAEWCKGGQSPGFHVPQQGHVSETAQGFLICTVWSTPS